MINKRMFPRCRVMLIIVPFMLAYIFVLVSPALADDWFVGKIIGLCKGTHIYYGSSESSGWHTIVPENDWAVKVIDGPRGDWWDTSRKEVDKLPTSGTGWVKKSEAESCKQSSSSQSASPASPQLTGSVSLSISQAYPGDRIEGSFSVRNNGGQDWRPQRLGIGVQGPFPYLDFGWEQGLNIHSGDSHQFHGTIPNSPDAPGIYNVFASWEDGSGKWYSLGGDSSFLVLPRPSSLVPSPVVQPPAVQPPVVQPPVVQPPVVQPPAVQPPDVQPPVVQPPVVQPPVVPQPFVQPNTAQPQISFEADDSTIIAGSCTTLRWDVDNVRAVYLGGQGVPGHDTLSVCPLSTQNFNLRVVLYSGEVINKSVIVYVTLDLGPSNTSGSSAQLTPEGIAEARKLFTADNFTKLLELVQTSGHSGMCLSDVTQTVGPAIAKMNPDMLNPPPPQISDDCGSAAIDILDLMWKNVNDVLSAASTNSPDPSTPHKPDWVGYALDCIPAVGGDKVNVLKQIGTANDIKDLLTNPEKIPTLVQLSLTPIPGSEPVSCIFSIGQNMQFQFWLENKAASGLWWLEGDFEKMWPAYNRYMDCLPLPNNDRTNCP